MTICTAILARNEADRYLTRVIGRCHTFSDAVLLLDDGSTDHTADLAKQLGCRVRRRQADGPMWGNESPARAELWDWAAEEAGDGWVLICDADQLLVGDPRPLCDTWLTNAWAFPLYDCWDYEGLYRADGYWQGYKTPRPWMFAPSRVPEGWAPEWPARGIHTGHCPQNFPMACGIAPPDIYWLHLGWLDPADREAKKARYLAHADHLTEYERAHAMSI